MGTATYRKVDVGGVGVFYREAGPKDAPTILLLHGFPPASHMFRDLIPQLAERFRLVAPRPTGVWKVGHASAQGLHVPVRVIIDAREVKNPQPIWQKSGTRKRSRFDLAAQAPSTGLPMRF
jgi:pimeloyl-ACP methyl ester carboxylesterase